MVVIELALVLTYMCVLLIKSCDISGEVCATYGFGDDSSGLYLFFVFFGLSMVLLQFVIAVVRLYVAGYVPKILLVARAHSVSPWTITKRVMIRRQLCSDLVPSLLFAF